VHPDTVSSDHANILNREETIEDIEQNLVKKIINKNI